MIYDQPAGTFSIQSLPILDLVEQHHLPLYVYDSQQMQTQFLRLSAAFNPVEHMLINYACKANSNLAVLKIFQALGAGLDTVSINEVKMGLYVGFLPAQIIFTPSGVSFAELEEAIGLGVKINVDSIETLEYIGHKYPDLPLCIRINPHIMAGGNRNISVGHIDSKFGISVLQMPLVERIVKTLNIKIVGVHMHTGSDILDIDLFIRASEILFDVAQKFIDQLEYIDFGSGFKVQYKPNDYQTDIEDLGNRLSKLFNEFCFKNNKKLTLVFEPGKFLVSQSGYFFVRTNYVKQTISTVFACVDSGFNHLIRPMFYDAFHEIVNITAPKGNPKIYNIVGYICETDTFAWNRKIPEIWIGDVLCFKNAGAYCFSMASHYNARCLPAEVLIHEGKSRIVRHRETFEDLLRNQTTDFDTLENIKKQ